MKPCNHIHDRLVLFVERAMSPDDARRVEEHLSVCARCRQEAGELQDLVGRLRDPQLFAAPEDMSWEMLPRKLAERVAGSAPRLAAGAGRRWLPTHFGPANWALSLAASLVMACGLVWLAQQNGHAPSSHPAVAAGSGNEAFLAKIQSLYAREVTAEYLAECRDLVVNLLRAEGDCGNDLYDVSLEVARARQLLQRKRILDPDLERPEVARAKALFDEIESLLVNLSTSESCARPEELMRLERFIEREQILLRISLLQAELSEE